MDKFHLCMQDMQNMQNMQNMQKLQDMQNMQISLLLLCGQYMAMFPEYMSSKGWTFDVKFPKATSVGSLFQLLWP